MGCVVYQATNLINGKRYIGITSLRLSLRISAHFSAADRGDKRVFAKAIRKYGREFIRFRFLKSCRTRQEALLEEMRIIALLKPEYNMTAGGDGTRDYRHDEKTRQRIGDASRGKKRDPQVILKWLETKKRNGRNSKPTDAQLKVFYEGRRRASIRRCKPVICLNDGLRFPSGVAAARYYGVSCASVCLAINGKRRSVCGKVLVSETT